MKYTGFRLLAFALGALFLGGCILPGDMPAYVNGGKTIVAIVHDEDGVGVLWTYDLQSKKATPYSLPGWDLDSARMIGEQVWTQWCPSGGRDDFAKYSCKLIDPVKNEFVAGPKELMEELMGQNWQQGVTPGIPVSYDGQKCLFLQTGAEPDAEGKIAYDVFTFPELKKKTTVKFNEVLPAGGFRWVTVTVKEIDKNTSELGQVGVFNQEGKQVLSILPDEARKMFYGGGPVRYARINEGDKVLLLLFGGRSHYSFGIFDTSNGKFLWGGFIEEDPLKGNPLVKRNEFWSLESKGGVIPALVRRRPGDKANESKLETIIYRGVDELNVEEYTPSPDGSHFVAAVNVKGKPSRLMFIPIKEGVTEKDVEVLELVAQKTNVVELSEQKPKVAKLSEQKTESNQGADKTSSWLTTWVLLIFAALLGSAWVWLRMKRRK